jgi:hypothetical protein
MAVAARFCDVRLKSGGASASRLASTLAPSLVHQLFSRVRPGAGGVGAGPVAARQPGGARAARHSPHRAAPARGCPVQVVGRGAQGPSLALGGEGPAPRRASAWPPRARRAVPVVGRWRCSGTVLALVRSCLTPRQRRCCTPAWDRATVWSVPPSLVDPGAAPVARRLLT